MVFASLASFSCLLHHLLLQVACCDDHDHDTGDDDDGDIGDDDDDDDDNHIRMCAVLVPEYCMTASKITFSVRLSVCPSCQICYPI